MSAYSNNTLSVANFGDPLIGMPIMMDEPKEGVRGVATKNDNGTGYRAGDIVVGTGKWDNVINLKDNKDGKIYGAIRAVVGKMAVNVSIDKSVSDGKLCILAIPQRFTFQGGFPVLTGGASAPYIMAKITDAAYTKPHTYLYLLVSKLPNKKVPIYRKGQVINNTSYNINQLLNTQITPYKNSNIDVTYNNQNMDISWSSSNYSANTNFISYINSSIMTQNSSFIRILQTEYTIDGNEKQTVSQFLNNSPTFYGVFSQSVLDEIQKTMEDIVYKDCFCNTLYNYFFNGSLLASTSNISNTIATSINTNLPVFVANKDGLDNMTKYLKGEDYVSDNADDMSMSALDLNTDWTIYVKGARKPNIYITEVSKGIESFIKSDANTTGLTKEDFKIQYRCPFWAEDKTESLRWDKTDITIPFLSQVYDYVYQTTYNDLIHVNYGGDFDIEAVQDMAFDISNPSEMPYAQMQFRIYLNEQKYSSWCEFGIGYIGSPTIADFDKQSPWGIVKGINDGSTVTIIYDEYPDGYAPDDYTKPPDDTDEDIKNGGTGAGSSNNGLSLLTTSYALTDSNLQAVGDFVWNATIFDDIKLINNSPLENIVSIKAMPIGLTGTSVSVKIGNIDTQVNGERIDNVPIINIGSLEWRGYYSNFLDYAPFTQAYIFLPFIGFYEIDPAQCTNHTLNVKYSFDIIMGQCKAMIFIDNIYYASYEGSCGVDIPIVGSNRAQLESGFLASAVTSAVTANPLPLALNLVNSQFQSQRSGSYSSTLGWAETRRCFVVFMLPNAQYPRTYGHDYGYPCNLSYSLGQLSGFTQTILDPDISGIACTDEEGAMIKQMLASGVYL